MPMASGSRTLTLKAVFAPLLPTTMLYVRPPRHTGACKSVGTVPPAADRPAGAVAGGTAGGVGQERAQTGSGESASVTPRSTAGRTVVSAESVAETPWFLMLAVAVAVLKMVEPADATT